MKLRIAFAFALCTTLALAACASDSSTGNAAADADAAAVMAGTPATRTTTPPAVTETCRSDNARQFVGQEAKAEVVEQARVATGANTTRVLGPNTAATMDFRGDRLNVKTDAKNVIEGFSCG